MKTRGEAMMGVLQAEERLRKAIHELMHAELLLGKALRELGETVTDPSAKNFYRGLQCAGVQTFNPFAHIVAHRRRTGEFVDERCDETADFIMRVLQPQLGFDPVKCWPKETYPDLYIHEAAPSATAVPRGEVPPSAPKGAQS